MTASLHVTREPSPEEATDVGLDPDGRQVFAVAVFSAALMLWNSLHSPRVVPFMLALVVITAIPRLRSNPLPWMAAALVWVPTLVVHWREHQDHVYLGAYWLLAVGLAMTQPNPRDQLRVMAHHARYLIGLTFAFAVVWKLSVGSFINGALFRHVLTFDERFEWPFNRILGGTSAEELAANEQAWDQMRTALPQPTAVEILSGPRFAFLVGGFVVMTLVVEMALAATFLSAPGSRLGRWRHAVLMGFAWTIYPFVPVLGFALLLMMMGAVTASGQPNRPRTQALYGLSAAGFFLAMVIRGLTL